MTAHDQHGDERDRVTASDGKAEARLATPAETDTATVSM